MDDWQHSIDEHLSYHARIRMGCRGIRADQVELALNFGRVVEVRGAEIYVIGRREVEKAQRHGVAIRELEGLHVVCTLNGGPVMTCYWNRDLRPVRDRTRHSWQGRAWKRAA